MSRLSNQELQKIIDEVVESIDFELIKNFYLTTSLKYPYQDKSQEFTAEKIKNDLIIIIQNAIKEPRWETIDNHWLIYYNAHAVNNTARSLFIYFTPIKSFIYNFKNLKKKNRKEVIQVQLEEAIRNEEYELAALLKKELERI